MLSGATPHPLMALFNLHILFSHKLKYGVLIRLCSMKIQRSGAVVVAVAAFILAFHPGRAQNVTVFTGDEFISLSVPPSVAMAPGSPSPLEDAGADQSVPIVQLGQTVQSRVAQVREILPEIP